MNALTPTLLLEINATSLCPPSDSALLRAYARWLPLEAERKVVDGLYDRDDPAADERHNLYTDHWWDLADGLRDMPAHSLEGAKAKAHVLKSLLEHMTHLGGRAPAGGTTSAEDMAWRLVADILAMGAAA